MLQAQLHGKLSRLAHRHLNELRERSGAQVDWENAVRGDEDTLTATVFSRLAYLDGEMFATLMDSATPVALGPMLWPDWPKILLEAPRFWPSLEPAVGDSNTDCVEPDVVFLYEECIIIVEAKWRGSDHTSEQWLSQIRAAREAYPERDVRLLAVGPRNGTLLTYRTLAWRTRDLLKELDESAAAIAWLDWHRLYDALERMRRSGADLPLSSSLVLNDLCAALEHRGYSQPRWLSDLTTIHPVGMNSGVLLTRWRLTAGTTSPSEAQTTGTTSSIPSTCLETALRNLVGQPALRCDASNLLQAWSLHE